MTLWLGILLVIVAGICNALFAAPMKRMPKWEWENQWGMWAVWALLVSAWSLAVWPAATVAPSRAASRVAAA